MEIKKADFDLILKYVKEELNKHMSSVVPYNSETKYSFEAISKPTMIRVLDTLTLEGCLLSLEQKKERVKKEVITTPGFKKWWEVFPKTSKFTFRGRTFTGSKTRVLRDDEEKTFKAYEVARKKAGFTDEQMLHCLKAELENRMFNSWKLNKADSNDLVYMRASVSYLNSGQFVYYEKIQLKEYEKLEDNNTNSA